MARIAVICGTGMSALSDEFDVIEEKSIIRVDTDWGEVPVTIIKIPEGTVAVIDRHHSSEGKRNPPHKIEHRANICLLYTSPSPRDATLSRMPSSA